MISRQIMLRVACISFIAINAGCYSHNPYGHGYGYPGNSGGYPQGGVIQAPGGFAPSVVPESTYQQGNSPTLAPTNDDNFGGSGNFNDNAPTFDNESSGNGDSGGVPYNPNDNEDLQDSGNNTFEYDKDDLSSPGDDEGDFFKDDPTGSLPINKDVEQVAYSSAKKFKQPKRFQPITNAIPIKKKVANKLKSTSPYGYDKVQYSWLRGVVDYDSENQSWHIMYNIKPEADDQFGGEFAMVSHPGLEKLKNGDVVLVKGYVDDSDRDAFGKVIYQVEELVPLKKK
jgi:hypothetical protein